MISGTQVAALVAFFRFLLRICFVPRIALTFTAMASWLYALVTGWQGQVELRADAWTPSHAPRGKPAFISPCNFWGCHGRCKNPSSRLQKPTYTGRSCPP